jgi:hypothetical protein
MLTKANGGCSIAWFGSTLRRKFQYVFGLSEDYVQDMGPDLIEVKFILKKSPI